MTNMLQSPPLHGIGRLKPVQCLADELRFGHSGQVTVDPDVTNFGANRVTEGSTGKDRSQCDRDLGFRRDIRCNRRCFSRRIPVSKLSRRTSAKRTQGKCEITEVAGNRHSCPGIPFKCHRHSIP